MSLTGYLAIEDIPGESRRADHEDEIDVFGVEWSVEQMPRAMIGRGRVRARADVKPVVIRKLCDRASPYLAEASARGRSFPEAVLTVRKDSGEASLDYLIITMENVIVSAYGMASGVEDGPGDLISEKVELDFETVTIKYTQQADDHSAGDEHEVSLRT